MQNFFLVMFASLMAGLPILQGCAASPTAVEATVAQVVQKKLTIQGVLILKGNDPFIYPVLVSADGTQWELKGLGSEEAKKLQNQPVAVQGHLIRGAGAGMLAMFQVGEIASGK